MHYLLVTYRYVTHLADIMRSTADHSANKPASMGKQTLVAEKKSKNCRQFSYHEYAYVANHYSFAY